MPDVQGFAAPYTTAVKELDGMFILRGAALPSVTLETGWAESYPKLKEDVKIWMDGGVAGVWVCFLVKLQRHVGDRFSAFVEVARQVPGGGWAFDARNVSFKYSRPPGTDAR